METTPVLPANQTAASFIDHDTTPNTDPASPFWAAASRLEFDSDFYGQPIPGHRSQVFLQWSMKNLYLLFVCPYQQLHLRPDPNLASETNELWNWDVAEVFIGDDFKNIRHYKEWEVSPQAEWVDLDVNLDNPPHEQGWVWQSGCEVAARIDAAHKTWYGFMRIPWPSIDTRLPTKGNELRINFYRCQGANPDRKYINWQPVQRPSFHTPEAFGILKLIARS